MIYTHVTGEGVIGGFNWMMADLVLSLMKKALSLVPKLPPKIVNIDSSLNVVRYASGRNEASFFQLINNGVSEMEKWKCCGSLP